jgi:hypothetical protein
VGIPHQLLLAAAAERVILRIAGSLALQVLAVLRAEGEIRHSLVA